MSNVAKGKMFTRYIEASMHKRKIDRSYLMSNGFGKNSRRYIQI